MPLKRALLGPLLVGIVLFTILLPTSRVPDRGFGGFLWAVGVDGGNPPVAIINASARDVAKGEEITFNGSSSYDPDGDELTYEWDLGDGEVAAGPVVTHAYLQCGNYTVVLTVSDGHFNTTASITITVRNRKPKVSIEGPSEVPIGVPVTFVGNATDPDGDEILSYVWDFGDGGRAEGRVVNHTFNQSGIFYVTVYASDGMDTGTYKTPVKVLPNKPPVAEGGEDCYLYNLTVTLSAEKSKDPENHTLTYEWDLGDGTNATGIEVTHTYPALGTYRVVLTVRDPYGGVSRDTFLLHILDYETFHPQWVRVNRSYSSEDGVEMGMLILMEGRTLEGTWFQYYYSEGDGYRVYELDFPRGTVLNISVKVTEGSPIDVFILDEENMNIYSSPLYPLVEEPVYAELMWLETTGFCEKVSVDKKLYLVVDNNNRFSNGADPEDVVYYHVEISPVGGGEKDEREGNDEDEGDVEINKSGARRVAAIVSIMVIIIAIVVLLIIAMMQRGGSSKELPQTPSPSEPPAVGAKSAIAHSPPESGGWGMYAPTENITPGDSEEEVDLDRLWKEAGLDK